MTDFSELQKEAIERFPQLSDVLGHSWPADGPLGHALVYGSLCTDANYRYHQGALLTIFGHEMNRLWFRQGGKLFRYHAFLVGDSAASKTTAVEISQQLYEQYRVAVNATGHEGVLRAQGTTRGLLEAIASQRDPNNAHTLAVLLNDEIGTLLKGRDRNQVMSMLCQLADGTTIEQHLSYVKRANRITAGAALERLEKHAVGLVFATTFTGLRKMLSLDDMAEGAPTRFGWYATRDTADFLDWGSRSDERTATVAEWCNWERWASSRRMALEKAVLELDHAREDRRAAIEPTLFQSLKAERNSLHRAIKKRQLAHAEIVARLFAVNDKSLTVLRKHWDMAVRFEQERWADAQLVLSQILDNPLAQKAQRVFDALVSAGDEGLTKRQVYRVLNNNIGRDMLDLVISTLEDEGSIEIASPAQIKPGRKGVRYQAVVKTRHGGTG